MKYTLLINQYFFQKYYPELKVQHAVVFEIIKSVCNSQSDKIIRDDEGFTWVASSLILTELPMLQLKSKSALTPILHKLSDAKLIEIKSEKRGFNFYKITENAIKLEHDLEEMLAPFKKLNSPVKKIEQPRSKNLTYPITTNPITNYQYINNCLDWHNLIENNGIEIKKLLLNNYPEWISDLTVDYLFKFKKSAPNWFSVVMKENQFEQISKWADTLDKLHRIDEHTIHEIKKLINTLFNPHTTEARWIYKNWIVGGNLRGLQKLRKKIKSGGDNISVYDYFKVKLGINKQEIEEFL